MVQHLESLDLDLTYESTGKFQIRGNSHDRKYASLIRDFLGTRPRATELSIMEGRDRHYINLRLDLASKEFSVQSDTGDEELTNQILREVLRRLPEPPLLGTCETRELAKLLLTGLQVGSYDNQYG